MDAFRYYLALTLLVATPPTLLTWLFIHPLVRIWRRVGPAWTYALLSIPNLALAVVLFRARGPLLAIEYGTQPLLVTWGLLQAGGAIVLAIQVRKQLTLATLVGLPEVDPKGHPGHLLTEGIYGWIRHPRYVEGTLGIIGWSLLANYLAIYLLDALLVLAIYALARLEERELRVRFGEAYADYCQRVPRFVPRLRRR